MKEVKIVNGHSGGYSLKVDGLYIGKDANNNILAIKGYYGTPYGAISFDCIRSLRKFWNQYRPEIQKSLLAPKASVWGQFYDL